MDKKREIKILDFDIENRPLSYWFDGRPTAEITAIASCWVNDINTMQVHLLGLDEPIVMLQAFLDRYNEADMVCGHYIRRHDLPIINGALMEYGLPQLTPKLTCDTRIDLIKKGDIPATQEYLSELFDLPLDKEHVSQKEWRDSNRLLTKALKKTHKRVTKDVLQNIMLRDKMLSLGLLKPPRVWLP